LAHRLSEEVLAHLISISTQAYILKLICQTTPHVTLSNPSITPQVESIILQLHDSARSMTEEVRHFFWPWLAHKGTSNDTNQKRWAPYDGPAWDRFFTDFVRFVKPRLQTLEILRQQLKRLEPYDGTLVKQDGSQQPWSLGDYILYEPYYQLNFLLTETGFEATVFSDQ
jgi:hypothetical protein